MNENNELNLETLIDLLKKQYCNIKNLRKGDVVIAHSGSWLVDSIYNEPNGFFTVTDANGNGFMNMPGDELCMIIDRYCLR